MTLHTCLNQTKPMRNASFAFPATTGVPAGTFGAKALRAPARR